MSYFFRYKSFIYFILGFALFYLSIDSIITYCVKKSTFSYIGKVNRICTHTNIPQIAFFGASSGEKGVNTEFLSKELKKSTFNFCIDGTSFLQYEGLIDEISNGKNIPETIVLTETYLSLCKKLGVTEIERYVANINNENVYNSLKNVQFDLAWKCKYVPMYKYIAVSQIYFANALKGLKNVIAKTNEDTLLGQIRVNREWELSEDEINKNIKKTKIELDEFAIQHYSYLLQRLKPKTKVIVILMPAYNVVANKIYDISPTRNAFSQICKTHNIPFYDFTQSNICDDKTNFYNSNHLNTKGANIFTENMLKILKNNYQ